jgi:hypothetical protein
MTLSPIPEKDDQQAKNNPVQPTDRTTEDLDRDRDTQATGLVGRPSEIVWLRSLQMDRESARFSGRSEYPLPLSASYFLDNIEIIAQDPIDYPGSPSKDPAIQIVQSYFQNVHASFPFLGKLLFWEQFRRFYAHPGAQPGRRWIAILNLVFAISLRHTSLVRKEPRADIPYFTKAWELYTRDSAAFDHPSLQQVQVESLISLYLLSLGQINRYVHLPIISIRLRTDSGQGMANVWCSNAISSGHGDSPSY